jgi:CheY-like chemotaxis protein
MSPMWRFYSASSSDATYAPTASQWNLHNPPLWHFSASPMQATGILILSDINMPGMSGLELLPKAKALRPDVPVIMITVYGDAETKRKALENGAEAMLTKPIDFATLRSEIDMRVERAA